MFIMFLVIFGIQKVIHLFGFYNRTLFLDLQNGKVGLICLFVFTTIENVLRYQLLQMELQLFAW